MLVLRQTLAYGLEQALLVLARLLRHRRGVDHPGSFRLGHLGACVCVFPFRIAFFGLARVRFSTAYVDGIRWLSRELFPCFFLLSFEKKDIKEGYTMDGNHASSAQIGRAHV